MVAGVSSTIVLLILDVPYAVALGLLVAILDLIPLAGATLAAIILTAVAFLTSIPAGIIVLAFMIVYQQIENHLLQPLVYSRTVQLSPLAILIAVLIGAKIAGILGALAAIPVAGTIQVLLLAWLRGRRERGSRETAPFEVVEDPRGREDRRRSPGRCRGHAEGYGTGGRRGCARIRPRGRTKRAAVSQGVRALVHAQLKSTASVAAAAKRVRRWRRSRAPSSREHRR